MLAHSSKPRKVVFISTRHHTLPQAVTCDCCDSVAMLLGYRLPVADTLRISKLRCAIWLGLGLGLWSVRVSQGYGQVLVSNMETAHVRFEVVLRILQTAD